MRAQQFKLDSVEFKNIYISLIDVHNFEERLINFVYFFETPGMRKLTGGTEFVFHGEFVTNTISAGLYNSFS